MPRRLEFFFDYVSPFSYLANSQLPESRSARAPSSCIGRCSSAA